MKKSILLVIACLLSACHEPVPQPLTRAYLMQHPDDLAARHKECEQKKSEECQLVNQTFYDFSDLYQALQQNPQQFGQQVLEGQLALSIAKENLDKAKREENADLTAQAQKLYEEKQQAMDDRLAVLRMMSPN